MHNLGLTGIPEGQRGEMNEVPLAEIICIGRRSLFLTVDNDYQIPV